LCVSVTLLCSGNPLAILLRCNGAAVRAALSRQSNGQWSLSHARGQYTVRNRAAANHDGALLQASADTDAVSVRTGSHGFRAPGVARRGIGHRCTTRRCARPRRHRREWASLVGTQDGLAGLPPGQASRQGQSRDGGCRSDLRWRLGYRGVAGGPRLDRPASAAGSFRAATAGAASADVDHGASHDAAWRGGGDHSGARA
jgi:hypothetical protein